MGLEGRKFRKNFRQLMDEETVNRLQTLAGTAMAQDAPGPAAGRT